MRQYIGARYMPKFVGAYSGTTAYEALSVVDDGMGTSYVSNKPVPAGTPLTDTNYWAVYGASNGAILDLQTRMTAAEGNIVNLDNTKEDNRNIIIFGNSYVDRGCANSLAKNFKNAYKITSGGVGFLQYTGITDTFESLVDSAILDASFENDTITDIIFVSAMGDCRAYNENPSTFVTNLASTLASIKTKIEQNFVNCSKVKLVLAETRDVWGWSTNKYNALFKVHRIFEAYCARYGLSYIGWCGFNALFIGDYVDTDHYHPTSVGAAFIGECIEAAYFGSFAYIPKRSVGQAPFNYCADGVITAIYEFTPDRVDLFLRRATCTQNAPVTFVADNVLIDFSGFAIPLPPPDFEIDLYTPLIRSDTGVAADMLTLRLIPDSASGRCNIYCSSNPNASTVLATFLTLININHISYMP